MRESRRSRSRPARRSPDRVTSPRRDRRSGATTTWRRPARLRRRPELVRAGDQRGAPRARADEPSGCWNARRPPRPICAAGAPTTGCSVISRQVAGPPPLSGAAPRPAGSTTAGCLNAVSRRGAGRRQRSHRSTQPSPRVEPAPQPELLPARDQTAARVRARPSAAGSRPARAARGKRRPVAAEAPRPERERAAPRAPEERWGRPAAEAK